MSIDQPADTEENEHGKVMRKQCPQCEGWFSTRGYNSHNRFCTSAESETPENGTSEASGTESAPDESPTEVTELDLMPKCPDCEAEVHSASGVAQLYAQNGYAEQADTIKQYDYYCDQCHHALEDTEVTEQ